MKYKKSPYIGGIVFSLLLATLVPAFGNSVLAAVKGEIYTASAHAYYRHPVTGVVEDAGNNEGIGQGMADKMLNDDALIEKTEAGEIYVTLRLYLTQFISDVFFWTQERNTDSWTEVSHQVMQENMGDEDCTDYRLELPAKDAVVKCSFFVEPMGRAIIIFMDFSDWKAGSEGDFIVSVDYSGQEITPKEVSDVGNEASEGTTPAEESPEAVSVPEADINAAAVSEAATSGGSAQELIASAKGLVVSDGTLLGEDEEAAAAVKEESSVSEAEKGRENRDKAREENILPALSWKLVWQCILIITLPGLLTGSGLYLLVFLTERKEGKR